MRLLSRRREKRTQRADAEAMRTGLLPDPLGLWVWSGRGWYHGADTAERRAQAVPLEPCPHTVTRETPMLGTSIDTVTIEVLCLSCGKMQGAVRCERVEDYLNASELNDPERSELS